MPGPMNRSGLIPAILIERKAPLVRLPRPPRARSDDRSLSDDKFCADLMNCLKLENFLEIRIAQSIAEDHWRLNRVFAIESNIFALGHLESPAPDSSDESVEDPANHTALNSARVFLPTRNSPQHLRAAYPPQSPKEHRAAPRVTSRAQTADARAAVAQSPAHSCE